MLRLLMASNKERNAALRETFASGAYTLEEIGAQYDLSRQRVWAIVNGVPTASRHARPRVGRLIYFVAGGGLIKIGVTKDWKARWDGLRAMSPVALTLLGTHPGGRARECELHQQFRTYQHHGEWFLDVPEIRSYITAHVCQNTDLAPV